MKNPSLLSLGNSKTIDEQAIALTPIRQQIASDRNKNKDYIKIEESIENREVDETNEDIKILL